ncbi:MAG: YggT family protein [Candidatus Omnitrophota bacterium]
MFVIANFLVALAQILSAIFTIFWWLLLIRVLISWVNPDPFNVFVQFLYRITEPVLVPIRRFLPMMGPVDLSPLVAFFLIIFLRTFLIQTILDLAYSLR